MSSTILVWLYTFGFALLHSLMAANAVKQRFYSLGVTEQCYRLGYSVLGVVSTVIWLLLIHALPDSPLYQVQGWVSYLFYTVQLLGVLVALAALLPIDGAVFLGLKKAMQSSDPFVVQGIYKYIRHPMYAGAMLYLLAKPEQSIVSLNFALVVCLYFMIGSKFEEKRMLQEHPDYIEYQKSVGAFVPKLWNRG